MWQMVAVAVVLLGALYVLGRALYRTLSGRGKPSCPFCPHASPQESGADGAAPCRDADELPPGCPAAGGDSPCAAAQKGRGPAGPDVSEEDRAERSEGSAEHGSRP
jgi:hypothetical protein